MENQEVAAVFEEIASLMRILQDDPKWTFKAAAYDRAVRSLESYPERVEDLARNPDRKLTEIPGVGEDLAKKIKEMVETGAHNQRAEIRAEVEFRGFLWLEDLIDLVEDCGSSEVYSRLEREDEKHLPARALENPAFVEDVVRKVAKRLDEHPLVTGYEVAVESFESIHHHDAYAYICRFPSADGSRIGGGL